MLFCFILTIQSFTKYSENILSYKSLSYFNDISLPWKRWLWIIILAKKIYKWRLVTCLRCWMLSFSNLFIFYHVWAQISSMPLCFKHISMTFWPCIIQYHPSLLNVTISSHFTPLGYHWSKYTMITQTNKPNGPQVRGCDDTGHHPLLYIKMNRHHLAS